MDVLGKIKKLQKARGYNNAQLARRSKLAPTTLQGLYKRDNMPTLPTLIALCSGLDITLSQFFAESSVPPDLPQDQIKLLEQWNMLNEEQREALLHFLSVI